MKNGGNKVDILGKIGKVAKSASEKASDAIEISRINSEIHTEEDRIVMLKQEIGEYYWAIFATGNKLDEEAMELCEKIFVCHDRIRSYDAEIQNIKTEKEDRSDKEKVEKKEKWGEDGTRCCKECGATLKDEMKFCGTCGKPT